MSVFNVKNSLVFGVLFGYSVLPAFALVSGNVLGDDIPVNLSCESPDNYLIIYPSSGYISGDICNAYDGLTWRDIISTELVNVYPVTARVIEMDSTAVSAILDCQFNLTYDECLSAYPDLVVNTSVAYFADTLPVPAQSSVTINPARIIFVGRAFPEGELSFHLLNKDYLDVTLKELTANSRGDFFQELTNSTQGKNTYSLKIKDKDGNLGETKFFTYDLVNNTTTHENNILFAPTIVVNKSNFAPGEPVVVSGYSGPGNKLEVLLDDNLLLSHNVNDSGIYRIQIAANKLSLGGHKLQVRQSDPTTGVTSNLSQTRKFTVSSFAFSGIDFNQDAKVDIQDWSIFLSNWSSQDQQKNRLDDLNNDGKVDIGDFSIFLNSFKLVE